ncbi:MAG TPA: uroporphyrinogen decarboxylase family protein [Armatimonadota bacterium]|jgi:hypothetical protein
MTSPDIATRKQRWRALYDQADAAQYVFTINLTTPELPRPLPWPSLQRERIAWSWETYCRQRERVEWLPDDSLPYLDVFTGTEIFAEAFGCAVHRLEGNMPFAQPLITRAEEVAKIRVPELSTSSLARLFDIADALRERAGEAALVRLVDVQSPMDIAALIWDKSDFFVAMLEEPEAVNALTRKVSQLLTAFLDAWFARYGRDFIAHYPAYYMADGLTLSEDEVGSVNQDTFDEFFLPELVMLSERYGGLGMHCCAHARHQWEHFLRIPGLRTLNLVQPPEVLADAYHFFAPHVAQMHSSYGTGEPWNWPAQLPRAARVIFDLNAASRDEALTLAARMREACESAVHDRV